MEYADIIPYEARANSQLSIVKYCGSIKLGGEEYILDYNDSCKKIIDGEERRFPNLVKASTLKKPKKVKKPQQKLLDK